MTRREALRASGWRGMARRGAPRVCLLVGLGLLSTVLVAYLANTRTDVVVGQAAPRARILPHYRDGDVRMELHGPKPRLGVRVFRVVKGGGALNKARATPWSYWTPRKLIEWSAARDAHEGALVHGAGWPLISFVRWEEPAPRSASFSASAKGAKPVQHGGIEVIAELVYPFGFSRPRTFEWTLNASGQPTRRHDFFSGVTAYAPAQPVWIGLAANTAFWGAAWAVPLYGVRGLIRWRRRRRGLCVQCGYDLSSVEGGVCPECGARSIPDAPSPGGASA